MILPAAEVAAIVDLGKTRAKITLVSNAGGIIATRDAATSHFTRNLPHLLPLEAIALWCEESLCELYQLQRFSHLLPVTHGATAVALSKNAGTVFAHDYEHSINAETSHLYDAIRPEFAQSGSPSLPNGLNLGRQLFALKTAGTLAPIDTLLTYPQYWVWRWCGACGTDISSLGCHTDLWEPHNGRWSSLAEANHWHTLFPALIQAGGIAGILSGPLAQRIAPSQPIEVHWGLHDSNAALAAFLGDQKTFTLISTGTWLVAFAVGCNDQTELDEKRDTLWNVDIHQRPVASARFMAGREREEIATHLPTADIAALKALLHTDALALPAFAAGGCFSQFRGEIVSGHALSEAARAALASLYLALMIDTSLDLIESNGDIFIEGPLANDEAALHALAALRESQTVKTTASVNCVAHGAARQIFRDIAAPSARTVRVDEELILPLQKHRERWHRTINERQKNTSVSQINDEFF